MKHGSAYYAALAAISNALCQSSEKTVSDIEAYQTSLPLTNPYWACSPSAVLRHDLDFCGRKSRPQTNDKLVAKRKAIAKRRKKNKNKKTHRK